jgi:hypothetical protein
VKKLLIILSMLGIYTHSTHAAAADNKTLRFPDTTRVCYERKGDAHYNTCRAIQCEKSDDPETYLTTLLKTYDANNSTRLAGQVAFSISRIGRQIYNVVVSAVHKPDSAEAQSVICQAHAALLENAYDTMAQ